MTSAPRIGRLRARWRWSPLLVVVAALVAFGLAVRGDYVFDDVHSVAANKALVEPGAFWRAASDPSAFSATGQRMYRPVLLLSFVANLCVATDPWALKLGNVLLHAAVAVLLWSWLRALRVHGPIALAVAVVFAVHPLASEAINLTSARSELLLAAGVLVALRGHLSFHRGRARTRAVATMVVGTMIACGSKETGVVIPALLLVQSACTPTASGIGWNWRRAVAGVLPVLALVVAYLLLRRMMLGQATVDVLARTAGDPTTGHGRTLLVHLATMGTLLPRALLQVIVPIGLSLDPPVEFRTTLLDPIVLLGWGSVIGLGIACASRGRTAGRRRLGLAVAVLVALPWIVVPLNMPLAEHRMYGPMVGLCVIAAALLPRRWFAHASWRAPSAAVAVTAAASLVFVILSTARTLEFRDEITLWTAEGKARSTSFHAWWGLGAACLRAGDTERAVEALSTARLLRPSHKDALAYLAEALVSLAPGHEQPERALAAASELATLSPDDPWTRTLVARAHLQVGRASGDRTHFAAAEERALSCLDIAPPKAFVFLLAAEARSAAGDLEGALAHLDDGIARGLDHLQVRLERARVLRRLGRTGEARRELARLQQIAPMEPAVLDAIRALATPPK